MKLSPMRYKDYVWPHNPRIYEIAYERVIAVDKIPFGKYHMQDMGLSFRKLRGEGEFVGKNAYDEFKKLATVFYDGTPGVLVHPVWQASRAYFATLELRQEPREDYVSYSFEFWEDYANYSGGLTPVQQPDNPASAPAAAQKKQYIVVSGDTLWDIALENSLSLDRLIALNPQISNPSLIYPGDTVYLS